ncbi:MAG: hypothetical protein ABEJ08_05835 [Halobacteriaceae archaeon]
MLRRLRETAPVGLVPLAWTFAAAAHAGVLDRGAVLIGHAVMATLLAAFAALSFRDMIDQPVLRIWLAVVAAGTGCTLAGLYALATDLDPVLVRISVGGWMAAPAPALVYTGMGVPADAGRWAYTGGGALSALAALLLAFASVTGTALALPAIALAGVGQTAGIVAAAVHG